MTLARSPVVVAVALAGLFVVLTGCTPTSLTELPSAISVSVQQNRPDSADRRLQVRLTNSSDSPLTVTSLRLSSPIYSVGADYAKVPATVRAHSVLDLPVILPTPDCGTSDTTPTVSIDFVFGAQSGHATLTPTDPMNQLPGIRSLDCLNASLASIASISMPDELRVLQLDGTSVALIDLRVTPTGQAGSFTITSVDDTVILGPIKGSDPHPLVTLEQNVTVNGTDAPSTLTIPVVPTRCDTHASAEDKRGTLLPLHVTVGSTQGITYLAATPRLTAELISFIRTACSSR